MKTNILNTMKQFAKYICAVVVMLGISVNVWGTASVSTSITSKTINVEGTSAKSSFSYTFSSTDLQDYWGQVAYVSTDPTTDDEGDGVYTYKYDIGIGSIGTYYTGETSGTIYVSYDIKSSGTYNFTATVYGYDDEWNMVEADVSVTINVTPSCSTSPTVTAGSYSAVRSTTATVSCSSGISSLGSAGCSISDYGFVIGTATGPAIGGSGVTKEQVGTSYATKDVGFSKDLTGLSANTKYYVRPYATNGNGTSYGTETSFTTLQRYTITYNKNDGSGSSATEYKDHGISYTVSSDKYSRSGYTLVKWHTLAAGTGGTDYAKGASYTSNANLSLHAVWGGTISYNNNGGSGSMDAAVVVSGGSYELPSCTFTPPSGKKFKCWAQGAADGTERAVGYSHTVDGDITFYAVWRDEQYTDYKFSCADWSVTGPSGDTVFITSTASKTVRSQEAFHVTASGLPASTALTFTTFPANTRFAFKAADGSALTTDTYGKIDEDFYVFYTPTSDDTSDGLDEITKIYVSVSGEPRKDTLGTKTIIGRHLPTNFVIAAKRNNQWYALPSNMSSTSNPSMVEIAVDDADNPNIAYTATSNMYSIAQPAASEYIRLKMKGQSDNPLFGSASEAGVGKSSQSDPDAIPILDGYQWKLVQKRATGLSNPQEAKYLIYCKNNSSNHLRLKENAGNPIWGLYNSGIEELRLIPAQEKNVVEAYFIEYGATGGIIEVDANGISAKKVKAKFNGNTSNLIALSQTLTSVNGSATKYNYTVTFDNDVNFAASDAVGKILMLEWYNSSDVLVGVTSIEMPKIIASSSTMSSIGSTRGYWKDLEVHVLPGATLTVNTGSFSNAVTIDHLEIYPGATVSVAPAGTAGTLTVGTLVLRNGWRRVGAKRYDVARLYLQPTIDASHQAASLVHTNAYSDWYIDFDQYYSIAVPFPVTISEMRYKNSNTAVTVSPTGTVRMRYYDGQNCVDKNKDNWKYYGTDTTKAVPNQLVPDSAYAITAKRPTGKAFSIIRMPMTFNDAWTTGGELGIATISATTYRKDTIRVTAYKKGEGTTPEQSKGWNYIANPFMSLYSGYLSYGVDDNIEYVNIPDSCFKEFTQLPMNGTSKLRPATGVLIQAPKTGRITFGATNRAASAPSYRNEEQPDYTPIQRAYIQLGNESTNDLMGLLISSRYSAEYEINADLQKLLGDGNVLRTYMLYNDIEMAYLAINEQLAQEWIPITIRIPTDGEYTFSMHEASVVGNLEGVYLIDYSNEQVTNLIEEDYTFNTTSGTISGRFAINAIAGQHETPTDIDIIQGGGDLHSDQPFKFLYHDKVFIYHRGVIYDATGKKVREINK